MQCVGNVKGVLADAAEARLHILCQAKSPLLPTAHEPLPSPGNRTAERGRTDSRVPNPEP